MQRDGDFGRSAGRFHHVSGHHLAVRGAAGIALGIGLELVQQAGEVFAGSNGKAAPDDCPECEQRLFDGLAVLTHPAPCHGKIAAQIVIQRFDPQRRIAGEWLGQAHPSAELCAGLAETWGCGFGCHGHCTAKILPGLRMPFGSSACLMLRISAISDSDRDQPR